MALTSTAGGSKQGSVEKAILFIASTREELRIAGSPSLLEHPTVPLESLVAAINIDRPPLLTGRPLAISAMGVAPSTRGQAIDQTAREPRLGVKSSDALLQLSEHYPFEGHPGTLDLQWDTAVTLAQVDVLIGMDVASEPDRPRWNPGEPAFAFRR